jgi:hypothetical protein
MSWRTTEPNDLEHRHDAQAFMRHRRLEELADYAHRGRRFAPLSIERVKAKWAESFRCWSRNVYCSEDKENLDDLASELDLRGEGEPMERVPAEWDAAWREIEEILLDAARCRCFVAAVGREYKTYLATVAAAKLRAN